MPPGRPPTLHKRSRIPDPDHQGRNLTYQDAICASIEATGLPATRCAESVGLPRNSVSIWLNEGRRNAEAQDKGRHLTVPEQRLAEFFNATQAAHGRWLAARMELHGQIAQGGITITETTLEVDPTTVVAGQPKVLKRSVKTKATLPDARAIEWELERRERALFSPRVEVTGAEGGPLAIDAGAMADQLAVQAEEFVAGAAAQAALDEERRVAEANGAEP